MALGYCEILYQIILYLYFKHQISWNIKTLVTSIILIRYLQFIKKHIFLNTQPVESTLFLTYLVPTLLYSSSVDNVMFIMIRCEWHSTILLLSCVLSQLFVSETQAIYFIPTSDKSIGDDPCLWKKIHPRIHSSRRKRSFRPARRFPRVWRLFITIGWWDRTRTSQYSLSFVDTGDFDTLTVRENWVRGWRRTGDFKFFIISYQN